jgi:hypothetical protein
MSHFVRLTPYNKQEGALCRRYTLGGRTFLENKWYRLDPNWSKLIKPLKQGSGCPFFEIIEGEAEWRDVVRKELAIKMAGPEAAQIAQLLANEAPLAKEPKEGTIKSKFDGMAMGEVSQVEEARAGVTGVVNREQPPPKEDDGPNLGEMTKAELLKTAEEYEIEISDPRMRKADLLDFLEAEIYGD